ncbi:putative peptide ABC transporter ATP-binding protein y4tS [Hyphomicrobiales bacterium]|nr:putative peptide ABC transporter ATP-binding protein y4tS [Hyphomicrobiales bacterium]CAH1663664.1 putative peptide ABC transporter ATP-binding protein y4tS [Hyphomicrobiales bacterium]
MAELLTVENVSKRFGRGDHVVRAVNEVSLTVAPGEILGIVGESGSGKSTLGRLITRLIDTSEGRVLFEGADLGKLSARELRHVRSDLQMVFQDPWAALNPRLSIGYLIEEPLKLHTTLGQAERRRRVSELAARVRLSDALLKRLPADLSGGQLQRVCIARALASNPRLIVLDEPTSSLDLSVRAGILDLLLELKRELDLAMIFISHDLGTVRLISDRVLVLYLGRVVEVGTGPAIFATPQHPYTQALLSAYLPPDPRESRHRIVLKGEIPSPINLPPGCSFGSRCPLVREDCRVLLPELRTAGPRQLAACTRLDDGSNIIALGTPS